MFTNKDNTSEANLIKDAKVLSGGERSGTTLMLLLAMGNMIDNPFRCMDEFDIFMYVIALLLFMYYGNNYRITCFFRS